MKKIIISAIAVVAAATLASCAGGTVASRDKDAKVKANSKYEMTAEKAANVYDLYEMGDISSDSKGEKIEVKDYSVNRITLADNTETEALNDGTYVFDVAVGKDSKTHTGKFTIAADGKMTFTPDKSDKDKKDFFFVSKDETVVCNGKNLTVSGKVTNGSLTLNYEIAKEPEETTDNTVKADASLEMTVEKAVGKYVLSENNAVIELKADGTYSYADTEGTYTVEADGKIVFSGKILSDGENAVCDGKAITINATAEVEGMSVNFSKNFVKQEEAEEEPANPAPVDNNISDEENEDATQTEIKEEN